MRGLESSVIDWQKRRFKKHWTKISNQNKKPGRKRINKGIQYLCTKPKVTSYKSPWQNGIAERFILSARTDLLNQVIVFNEDHLRRLMREYVDYYNKDRCHLSLDRNSPLGREPQKKTSKSAKVISISKIGGIQHRYEWKEAA